MNFAFSKVPHYPQLYRLRYAMMQTLHETLTTDAAQ